MSISFNASDKVTLNTGQNILVKTKNNKNFKGMQKDTVCIQENVADKILRENRESQQENSKKSSKYINLITLPALTTIFGSYILMLNKILKAKTQKLPQDEISDIAKNALKKAVRASSLAILTWVGYSSYFGSKREKYLAENKNYFNNINNTSAKLAEKEFNSSFVQAFYNGASGEIYMNKNNLNDFWSSYKNKLTIKHELVHARQCETVARMKDGVRKLNYAMFKNDANRLKKDATAKQMIYEAYNDVITDKNNKYENAKYSYDGYDIPFKDYIITMYKLINDKEKNYTDIPMLINAEHYNSVRERFGKLTPKEEQKAIEYYDGILNYVPVTSIISGLNPFSEYHKGVLEKEAYKENPWYTMLI